MFGSTLHALVDDAALRIPGLQAQLCAEGYAEITIRRIEPSLEDSFVQWVGGNK